MNRTELKWKVINSLRHRSWEVRRFDPFVRLDDYLHYVLFPHLGVNCVIDVGAREGEYATALRNTGYQGLIVSFEPVTSSFATLRDRAAHDPDWHVHNLALGDADGEAVINVMRTTSFSSFRTPRSEGVEDFVDFGNEFDHVETVHVRRLETMFEDIATLVPTPRLFLKMDTQGWDLEVFKGVGRCLDYVVGLQSEMSIRPIYQDMPDFRAALELYEGSGFAVTALYPVGRDRTLRLAEFDCVMLRADTARPAQFAS